MKQFLSLLGLGFGATALASDPFSWDMPPPEVQLAEDDTVIPLGKGALLVPALSDPIAEPAALLVSGDQETIDLPTGRRVLVDPGNYTVIVSSGTPAQGVATSVEVKEAETTVVPVTWGALRVEITDPRRVPHRGGYDLIRADTREPYGTGFGVDTLQGEQLPTWLLPPGVYKLVKVGSNYRALRDFATVYVPPEGFVRFRLVTDPDTGDLLGSGVLLPDDFGTPKSHDSPWFRSLILGVDGAFVQQSNLVGVQNQTLVSADVFLDGQLAWTRDDHTVSGLLQIEQGASWVRPSGSEPLPLVKSRDRVRGDLLYTWFPSRSFGPYARATVTTQAFPTRLLVTEDTTFVRNYEDGSTQVLERPAGSTFALADRWAPTLGRQGAGLNSRFTSQRWYTVNLRLGLGLQQNRFSGAWALNDDPNTEAIEYRQVLSFDDLGVEGAIIGTVRFPGWVTYATSLEAFGAVARIGAQLPSGTLPLRAEWRNTLSLRVTRNLSVNYYANFELFPEVVDRLQFEQSLLLRASFALL